MADKDGNMLAKDYGLNKAACQGAFHVKGMEHAGWGMKDRLSRIFRPDTGKTVMLAFDHGYIMGATAGLERLDLVIEPLADMADALMATRGGLRTCISPSHNKAVILRSSAGSTVLKEDMSREVVGVDINDAIRMNAAAMAVQCFVGAEHECRSLDNLVRVIDAGNQVGIPTLAVTAVGKEMERTPRYFMLATRVLAELGAHIVKTYYCDDFEKVVAACPVPLVIAGGKKVPEREALEVVYQAISDGAAGVDMGRNVFQSESPAAMMKAINAIVHDGEKPSAAWDLFCQERNEPHKENKN